MKLRELLNGIEYEIKGSLDTDITSVCYDSRKAKDGSLFFCVSGANADGHKFAHSAIENGAKALMVTHFIEEEVPQIKVENDRRAMALISANFYGNPAEKLKMIGITGTKGKTSSSYMMKSVLEANGEKVGLIGTISYIIGGRVIPAKHTTPEATDLQELLKEMLDEGITSVVMEVSSSALAFDRVYGIKYAGSIYTNLSQDHMDVHGSFENYAKAKSILFENSEISLINADDEWAEYMKKSAIGKVKSYSLKKDADYTAMDMQFSPDGTRFFYCGPNFKIPMQIEMPGEFMVYNAVAVASLSMELGINLLNVKKGIEAVGGVPGRFEKLDTHGRDFNIILDYAHTPASLESILKSVKLFAKGRVVCLFGCGGNRDSAKRPMMGRIAEKNSDFVIVTTDNPRFEEPADIIKDITDGMKSNKYVVIENRLEAIRYAIEKAKKNDVIVLAGKGHEYYQEIKGVRYDFNEKVIVEEILG